MCVCILAGGKSMSFGPAATGKTWPNLACQASPSRWNVLHVLGQTVLTLPSFLSWPVDSGSSKVARPSRPCGIMSTRDHRCPRPGPACPASGPWVPATEGQLRGRLAGSLHPWRWPLSFLESHASLHQHFCGDRCGGRHGSEVGDCPGQLRTLVGSAPPEKGGRAWMWSSR